MQPAARKGFGSPDSDSAPLGYIQPTCSSTGRVQARARLGRSWSRGSCSARWFGLVLFCYHAVSRYHQEAFGCLLGLLISHNRCNARVRLGVACDEWCACRTHANGSVSILISMIAVPVRRLSALSCALVRQEASAPSRRDGFVVSRGCPWSPLVVCPRRHPRCVGREWLEGRRTCIQRSTPQCISRPCCVSIWKESERREIASYGTDS